MTILVDLDFRRSFSYGRMLAPLDVLYKCYNVMNACVAPGGTSWMDFGVEAGSIYIIIASMALDRLMSECDHAKTTLEALMDV